MSTPLQLEGKVILVTGASSGIGRATAILLSRLGASVVLVARNRDRLQATVDSMQSGRHLVEPQDLTDLNRISDWFSQVVAKTGPLDGLVHSAGVGPFIPLRMITPQSVEQVMSVNFYAAVFLCKEFSRKQMHGPNSSVVLVSSVAGLVGSPAQSIYSASKGALIAFARSAAIELAKSKIRVNCVAPAMVQTDMLDSALNSITPEQLTAQVQATHPLGIGSPLDVAQSIAFLLADTGRWITGSVLSVDGGYTAQ